MEIHSPSEADLKRFHGGYEAEDGCWVWRGIINHNGYGHVFFMGKLRRAHRVAFFIKHGRWSDHMVLHSCDNRACVNPNHLKEGTAKENTKDMMVKGRDKHLEGEECPHAVLTEANVREIRSLRDAGELYVRIARRFQISARHVSNICAFKRWAHLT